MKNKLMCWRLARCVYLNIAHQAIFWHRNAASSAPQEHVSACEMLFSALKIELELFNMALEKYRHLLFGSWTPFLDS